MAVWRRKALELFPFLRHDLQQRDSTVYEVFFLLPRVSDVIDSGDTELLRKMFEFAEWCAMQPAQDLWNAAGVVFYEHVFDGDNWPHRHQVVLRLSPRVIADCIELWEHWLSAEKFAEVKPLLLRRLEGRNWQCAESAVRRQTSNAGMNESVAAFVSRYRGLGLDGTPATPREVAALERQLSVVFPAAYKAFLLILGRDGGADFRGSDCTIRHVPQLRGGAEELLQSGGYRSGLPEKAVVFLMHQGYFFVYFVADGTEEDPPVFAYREGDAAPSQKAPTFSAWLEL